MTHTDPDESRYIGFELGLKKSQLDELCKKQFPLAYEKIQKGHLPTSVDLFMEEQLPNAIQLIARGDPKQANTLFAIGYDITGRSESYIAKEETSLRLKLSNSRREIEAVFGRLARIDEYEEPAERPEPPAPVPVSSAQHRPQRFQNGYQGSHHGKPDHAERSSPPAAPHRSGRPAPRDGKARPEHSAQAPAGRAREERKPRSAAR